MARLLPCTWRNRACAVCVPLARVSKYLASASWAAIKSLRNAVSLRDNKAMRAFSRRSLTFSRKKYDCVGDSISASGVSTRRMRIN